MTGGNIKRSISLMFFLISIFYQGFTQRGSYHPLDFFDNQDGMSQGTINCIVQDKFGYMWLGTQDGLNKFDGLNFTVYKSDIDDPNSISDNYITALIEDREGNLWIGTSTGGLNKYDINTGIFESYKHQATNLASLSSNSVSSIAQLPSGDIWVGTLGGGLNRFDIETKTFERFQNSSKNSSSISSNTVQYLFLDSSNNLWIGTKKGLNRLDQTSNKFEKFVHDPNDIQSVSNNDILAIWEDTNHQLWIGTNGGGLNVMNKKTKSFKSFQHNQNDHQSLTNNNVISIIGGENGELWVATDGGGLNTVNIHTGQFTPFKVSFQRLKTLYKDAAGDIWVGLRGGLNKIGKNSKMFEQYTIDKEGNLIAPNGDIHALCVDKNNYIWSGSSVDGLKRIDRQTLETITYTNSKNPNSLSSNAVNFLYIDSNETMWVGTFQGLNKYNEKDDSFTSYLPNEKDPNSISAGKITYIYEDDNNFLWIGTDHGLNMFDRETGNFKVLKHDPENNNSLQSNNIASVLQDEVGDFWIGFNFGGFDKYNPRTEKFTHYTHNDERSNSLSNDRVSHIYDDQKGNLWIATYGGGLNKFEKATEKFTLYNEKQGLANPSLYCVIDDEMGNLWMSHNEGFSKFDVAAEHFDNYMEGVEFNGRAFYKARSGEVLLGGFDIVSFFPHEVKLNETVPPVHINEFSLFDKIITPSHDDRLVTKALEETDTLILNYDQNFFSFGFVSLNYTDARNNQYRYKLDNFDNKWNNAGNYTKAHYTNVPPGDYVFKVKGSNNDLHWNEVGDYIFVRILYPWWETIVFKIGMVILILLILILLYRLKVKAIKQQKEELEKLVTLRTEEVLANQKEIIEQKESITDQNNKLVALNEEKNELIQIVAHDLRSPLNQIKGLMSIVKMINPKLNDETNNTIDLVTDLVDRQSAMIGNILDTNAIDANKTLDLAEILVNNLIDEVVSTLNVVASIKNIKLETDFSERNLRIELDKSYFIQALENLLSNAIKFSPSYTKVSVTTHVVDNKARICVVDEGPGITPKDMKFLFEPYTKLSAKPTANEASSGLGLSIVKKYIEAMNGKIWCESEIGKGAKFCMEFERIE